MFEIAGADEEVSRRALKLAAYKLPIKCKIVTKAEQKKEQAAQEAAEAAANLAAANA
jgi:large subunit ribosomal protein L16